LHAETALAAVIACLRHTGLMGQLTFDHDPRWVGSPSGRDFPSALIRLPRLRRGPAEPVPASEAGSQRLRGAVD
jgi:hypothetical protein